MPDRPDFLSEPTEAINPVGFDRSNMLAWSDVQRTDLNQRTQPSADPTHSHWLNKLHLSAGLGLFYGRIVDEIAYCNTYKVQMEHGIPTIWATMITHTALQPIGARQLGQIAIGAGVIVALHNEDSFGIIIGVVPDPQTASMNAMPDFISQAGRSGLLVDAAHSYPLSLDNASMIVDYSAGRPFDATGVGEAGHITETGILDFIDSFMTSKRVDEECGFWSFWHDQLSRVAGHNLQIWSAGSEREDLDDEGEVDSVQGYTPYYWEALGAFEFGTSTCREIPTECWQKNPVYQGYNEREPCDDRQQAFYRLRDFYGYLGQAHKRLLVLPPVDCEGDDPEPQEGIIGDEFGSCGSICNPIGLNLLDVPEIYPGVFEENLALTGRLAIRSAHEIILSKHVLIPGPKQIRRPEDIDGDNPQNYKHAGLLGVGLEHDVQGEIDISSASLDDPTQIRAAGFMDTHAFVFNWIGEHPFHYHDLDWFIPDEEDLNYLSPTCNVVAFDPPAFTDLECNHFLEAPVPIPIPVDHRYGEVNYYPNNSYFGLLADGGVVIGCGFGAEIKLANGHIWLTAPGDINLQSGRDVTTFAGFDICLRAKNSWDISATNKDGRLKANNNLWLAATGECGGVLIQSFATKPVAVFDDVVGEDAQLGGICIKAEDSMVSTCAADITFTLTQPEDEDKTHSLIFDAGSTGRIKFKSQFFERFLEEDGAALDYWVSTAVEGENVDGCTADVVKGAEWWKDGITLCAPLIVDNDLMVIGCGIFKEDITSVTGHIATIKARKFDGKVAQLDEDDASTLEDKFEYFDNRCDNDIAEAGNNELGVLCDRQNNFTLCDAEFTFRTAEQYKTEKYVLFESRWQQMARITGSDVSIWREDPVNDTYPYPGAERFLDTSYRILDLNLYDPTTGLADVRGPAYEAPEFNTPESVSLDTSYLVII